MRKFWNVLVLSMLLIFSIPGNVGMVKGSNSCTPDSPCIITECTSIWQSGYYKLGNDIIVTSPAQLVPVNEVYHEGYEEYAGYSCIAIYVGEVTIDGNNKKIVLKIPESERPPKIFSAVYMQMEHYSVKYNTVENLIIEGWDVGIDMANVENLVKHYILIGGMEWLLTVKVYHFDYGFWMNPMIFNNTLRNNTIGIALSGKVTSNPNPEELTPPEEYWPKFAGIINNTFEDNIVGIFVTQLWTRGINTTPLLIAENEIKRNKWGISVVDSMPAVKEIGDYAFAVNWSGPVIEKNLIVNNTVGISINASKKLIISQNEIKQNAVGIIGRNGPVPYYVNGSPIYDEEYWSGVPANITISENEIRGNIRGLVFSNSENLTISSNAIVDNKDVYQEIEYTLPDGRNVTAYYAPYPALYGIGLYLYNVSNSLIEGNEIAGNGVGPLSSLIFPLSGTTFADENIYGFLNSIGAFIDISGGNNIIKNNYIHDNAGIGIYLHSSRDVIEENTLVNDYISTAGWDGYWLDFTIKDTTINGKPVVMIRNQENVYINDAAQVFIVNSSGVKVEGIAFINPKATPIVISDSDNIELTRLTINELEGVAGIYISESSGIAIRDSEFTGNYYPVVGIHKSENIEIKNNKFQDNFGMSMFLMDIKGLSVEGNLINSSVNGIFALNIEGGEVTDNEIYNSRDRLWLWGWKGQYVLSLDYTYEFSVTPVYASTSSFLPGMYPSGLTKAAILINGSSIVISNNKVSENSMVGIYIPNGNHVQISGNRIENNSLGGVVLGIPSRHEKNIKVKHVIIEGNEFIQNGLCITGHCDGLFLYRLLITEIPLVEDITVKDNTVNGKPLVYLENVKNVEIYDAGQIIAINSTLEIRNIDVPFTDIPVLLINSNATIRDSSFEGRYGISALRSNITARNVSVVHGSEYIAWEYYDPYRDQAIKDVRGQSSFAFYLEYSNGDLIDVRALPRKNFSAFLTGIEVYGPPTLLYPPVSVKIWGAHVENETIGIRIQVSDAEVRKSTVKNSGFGISFTAYENMLVFDNSIENVDNGIFGSHGGNPGRIIIANNTVRHAKSAIKAISDYDLKNFIISNNTLEESEYGISLGMAYKTFDIINNTISNNNIIETTYGIYIETNYELINNTISTNYLINNTYGIFMNVRRAIKNFSIYNNYFDNYEDVYLPYLQSLEVNFNTTLRPGRNIVNGPFIGGNYWAKYKDAEDKNKDGIADDPYLVTRNLYDYLPLIRFEPKILKNVTFPIVINESGYYRLEIDGNDLSVEYAIIINASNVLLDGNGHVLGGKGWAFYGVKVINAENVSIVNLNLKDWMLAGIYAENTNNIKISGNQITGDTAEGIDIRASRNIEVSFNILEDITGDGIYLKGSVYSSITHNNIRNVKGSGVEIDKGSKHNFLASNSITAGGVGFYLRQESESNILFGNWLSKNNLGVYIVESQFNLIYNNYFDNERNAKVVGDAVNYWNITKTLGRNILGGNYLGGNYWSELKNCEDEDLDGFCDVPYIIDESNIDYLPLTISFDTTPPEVTIIYPENTTYYQNVTEIKVRASDDHMIEEVKALVDGSTWVTLEFDGEYYVGKVNLGEGHHVIRVYAYDIAGNSASDAVEFTVIAQELSENTTLSQSSVVLLTYMYHRYYHKTLEEFYNLYNQTIDMLDNETLNTVQTLVEQAKAEYSWVGEHYQSLLQADIRALIHMRKAYLYIKKALELLQNT